MEPIHPTTPFESLVALRIAHTQLLRDWQQVDDDTTVPAEFQQRLESFLRCGEDAGAGLDIDEERADAQTLLNYWTTVLYGAGVRRAPAMLKPFDAAAAAAKAGPESPYRGLQPFEENEASLFFGRHRLIRRISSWLADHRFVVVVGLSGTGKSSLVRAGVIPSLREGSVAGSERWRFLEPCVPGSDPPAAIAWATQPPDVSPTTWRERVAGDVTAIATAFEREPEPVVLTVDQFEELFTLGQSEADRAQFIAVLAQLATSTAGPQHRVILAMRSDFESFLMKYPAIERLVPEDALVRLAPLDPVGLRHAIEKPAARRGVVFEAGLAEELIDQVVGEPAGLPLLQFTLFKLWQRREGRTITWRAYRALGENVRDILTRAAEETYASFALHEDRAIVRAIFQRLLQTEGGEATSRRVPRTELMALPFAAERIDRVLSTLVSAGMLRVPSESKEDGRIEITHEALIRNWERLESWIGDIKEQRRKRAQFRAALDWWIAHHRDRSGLLRGVQLAEAEEYADLAHDERAFVKASRRAAFRQISGVTLAIVLVLLIGLIAAIRNAVSSARSQESGRLALASMNNLASDPERSLLLALEAARVASDKFAPDVRGAMNAALETSRVRMLYRTDATPYGVAFARSSFELAVVDTGGHLAIVDAFTGEVKRRDDVPTKERTGSSGVPFAYTGRFRAVTGDTGAVTISNGQGGAANALPLSSEVVQGLVFSLEFDSAEQQLAIGTSDGPAIWDVVDRRLYRPMRSIGGVVATAFSSDGKTVATAGTDGATRIWGRRFQEMLFELNRPDMTASAVAYVDSAKSVIIGTAGGQLLSWRPTAGVLAILAQLPTTVNVVKYAPDGRVFAVGEKGGDITVFRVPVKQLRIVASARQAASMSDDREPTRLLETLAVLKGHTGAIRSIDFSPDGRFIASASEDNTVRVWDVTSEPGLRGITSMALSSDAQVSAAITDALDSNGQSDQQVITSVDGLRQSTSFRCRMDPGNLAVKKEQYPFKRLNCSAVALSADGRRLAVAGDGGVTIHTTTSGQRLPFAFPEWYTYDVALSADGRTLATSGLAGLRLWDVDAKRQLSSSDVDLAAPPAPIRSLALRQRTGESRTFDLAAGLEDGHVMVWHLGADGKPSNGSPKVTVENRAAIVGLTFGPKSREDEIASVDADGIADRWNTTSLQQIASYSGPRVVFGADIIPAPKGYNSRSRQLAVGGVQSTSLLAYDARGTHLSVAALDGFRIYDLAAVGAANVEIVSSQATVGVGFSEVDGAAVGIDVSGSTHKSLPSYDALARQVQSRILRPFSPLECSSYFESTVARSTWLQRMRGALSFIIPDRSCAATNEALQHLVNSVALAKMRRFDDSQREHGLAGQKYARFATPAPSIRADALRDRAFSFYAVGNWDAAIADLEAAHELEPNREDVRAIFAAAERLAKDYKIDRAAAAYEFGLPAYEVAVTEFERLRLADPAAEWTYPVTPLMMSRYLGNICWYAGEKNVQVLTALRFCERAVAMEPKPGLAHDNRALARARLMNITGAVEDMQAYVDENAGAGDLDPRRDWLDCVRGLTGTAGSSAKIAVCTDTLVSGLKGDPSPIAAPGPSESKQE